MSRPFAMVLGALSIAIQRNIQYNIIKKSKYRYTLSLLFGTTIYERLFYVPAEGGNI